MRTSEIAAITYGGYIALVALRPRWGRRRRGVTWICAALMIGAPLVLALSAQSRAVVAVRDWAPAVYILISYYASGTLFVGPSPAFEAWLVRADGWLLRGWRAAQMP
ncbi:MAG TPA: hypothetical protein VGY48_27650, partial [Vicinamibacterales bacterium]|nr:hypothetical protein [Vicinamibacterales bacterium]